jgi:diguanylate cyclase (GGDEF)-like protein/PAS domain S-box-containing protein
MTNEHKNIRTILIVDDTPENVSLLEAILSPEYTIRTASQGSEALQIAREMPPDLILLDILMPDMNGYDVCRALKADAATKRIPVIFVTAMLEAGDETNGFEAGGVDFITKPVIGAIVRSRVKAHLALKEAQDELEEWNSNLKKRLLQSIRTIRNKTDALQSVELLNTEIQDAREYAEDIVETVREPLVVLNSDLKILTVNHSFYDTFKVTPEETIGHFIYDLGNRQWDIPKLRVLFKEILLHHIVFNGYEVEHYFQGIGRKIILLNARQIYREKIGSHIILLAMEDITGRRQLEEERDRLAMIVEFSNDAIFSISLDDVITSWNKGAEKIFGYYATEIIGRQIFTLIPAKRYFERAQILQAILNGEQVRHFETTRIRKDGSQIYVSITASPILNADGKIISNSVIARDITERKQTEEYIEKLRRRNESILDAAGEGIIGLDTEGIQTFINPAATRMLGYFEDELIGKRSHEIWHHKKPDGSPYPSKECPIYASFKDGESHHETEDVFWRKDGSSFPVEYKSTPIIKQEIVIGAVVAFSDITKTLAIREQLEKLSITDTLTGLYNRRGFFALANPKFKLSQRKMENTLLIYADMDNLKVINDNSGHQEGDKALVEIANILNSTFRDSDILARLGGDEFAILAIDTCDKNEQVIKERIQKNIDSYNNKVNTVHKLSLSVGIVCYDPEKPCTLGDLLSKADTLMYDHKLSKKG